MRINKIMSDCKHKKLYIVDAYSIFFKAYYANPKLIYRDKPVGMLYGAIVSIMKLISSFKPYDLIFVLDGKGKSFRHEMYNEYKSNRPKIDDDLIYQLGRVKYVLEKMNIKYIQKNNYEADDVIATLTNKYNSVFNELIIVSVDKDLLQLVNKNVFMFHTMYNMVFSAKEVFDKYSIYPEQIVDYLALVGDAADNIPGVKSVGPKTAAKLLLEYSNLSNIYENIDSIKQASIKKSLVDNKTNAFLSKDLVLLKKDIDLGEEVSFEYTPVYEINDLISEFGFKSLTGKVLSLYNSYQEPVENNKIILIETESDLNVILDRMLEYGVCCLVVLDDVLHIGLGNMDYNIADSLKVFVWDFIVKGNTINIVYDIKRMLYYFDVDLNIFEFNKEFTIHDIQILYYLYNRCQGVKSFYDIINNFSSSRSIFVMYDIFNYLQKEVINTAQYSLYVDIELYMPYILYSMENNGVLLDKQVLFKAGSLLKRELFTIEESIFNISDERFQISSNKVLGEILFDKLKLPHGKKLKKSNTYSTDVDVLNNIKKDGFEIGDFLLSWRRLAKMYNTYISKLPLYIDEENRVHSSFNSLGTITGRLNSFNPNLQNIPTDKEYNIRSAFISEDGYSLVSFDYSQIELVVLAYMINEENMKYAFENDIDIHKQTAASIFNVAVEYVTDIQRKKGKMVNFGVVYGMSSYGLSKSLDIGLYEAKNYMESFFNKYPKIKDFIDNQIAIGENQGYVTNAFNRCMSVDNNNIRAAINLPIQSTASDILKVSMIKIFNSIKDFNAKLVLQVHDELVFEVSDNELDKFVSMVSNAMSDSIYPLNVKVSIGKNWGEN